MTDNAGITKNLSVMYKEYAASIGTTEGKLTEEQKRLAIHAGMLNEAALSSGNAAKAADTFNGRLSKLSATFLNLKVAIGNVFLPVLNLIIPVLNNVLLSITRFFNGISEMMSNVGFAMPKYSEAATSGITSIGNAASNTADNIESTGDAATAAAKKVNKAFAGLDEITVLNFNKDSDSGSSGSGAGAGAGVGASSVSPIETVSPDIEGPSQKLSEWLNKSAYDWGFSIGEAINKGFQMIPWDTIQGSAMIIGVKLGEFLNGAVDGLDWQLLGNTLGEGFNTVLYGLYNFYSTFNWDNLGVGLGEGINGVIESVNWEELGALLGINFSSVFQVLSNMFGTIKWEELGLSLGNGLNSIFYNIDYNATADTFTNGLNGMFISIGSFSYNVDFSKIGEDITNGLNRAINGIDFGTIETAFSNSINGIIDFAWSSISSFDGWNFGKKIGEAFNSFGDLIGNIDWEKVGETVSEFIIKLIDSARGIIRETDWGEILAQIVTAIAEFSKGIDWLDLATNIIGGLADIFISIGEAVIDFAITIGENIVDGIWEGITNFLSDPLGWLKENLVDPIVNAVKNLLGIHSPSTVFAEIGKFIMQGLENGISSLFDSVKDIFSKLLQKIKDIWSTVSGWFNTYVITPVKNFFTDMWEKIKTGASNAWSNIKNIWSVVSGWFNTYLITPVKNFFTNMWENLKTGASNAWSGIKNIWNVVNGWFNSTVISPVKNFFSGMWNNLKTGASNAWSGIKNVFSSVTSWFKDTFSKAWTAVKNVFSTGGKIFDGIKAGIENTFKTVVNSIIRGINTIITIPFNSINGMLNKIRNVSFFDISPFQNLWGNNPLSVPQIPQLAQGGYVGANNPQLAIIGDNKREGEIVTPESKIRDNVKQAIEELGGIGNNTQAIDLTINVKYEDGRTIIKKINSQQMQDGVITLMT